MRKLNFKQTNLGTWEAEYYVIEAYEGGFQPFKETSEPFHDTKMFGPTFTHLDGAIKFYEADMNNPCLLS